MTLDSIEEDMAQVAELLLTATQACEDLHDLITVCANVDNYLLKAFPE